MIMYIYTYICVYIHICMYIYIDTYVYMCVYVYSVTEQNCISPSGEIWEVGERKKILDNEKYWKNPSIYEYNIMQCTVSCWILGELCYREWVSNGGNGVNLIKAW
jgi:hypothetical protein